MTNTSIAVHFIVYGHVQGVGFRSWTASLARHFNIKGWVRNNEDGSVELVAEGSPESIEQFASRLKEGNSLSTIEKIHESYIHVSRYTRFEIIP